MQILPIDADDEMILNLVRQWVNLLANDQVDAAQALLSIDEADRDWTPALIREVIAEYEYDPGVLSRITPVETAQIRDLQPYHTVDLLSEINATDVRGTVEFDLPINGFWSDLTAIFWIKSHPQGLVLELYDIHIL